MGVVIKGYGRYLPSHELTNEELLTEYPIKSNQEWIEANLGIKKRSWAQDNECTSHLAYEASYRAVDNASLQVDELDRIILGTSTADHTNLSTACKVQKMLGASCPSFDVVSACSSFMFALQTGIDNVNLGREHVLCIGADLKSRFVNKNDRKFLPIFGDGAAAFVLAKGEEEKGFVSSVLWSDGSHYDDMKNPAGGSALPASHETVDQGLHATVMSKDGTMVTSKAAEIMAQLSQKACTRASMSIEEIDYVVPHHANETIMLLLMKNLGLSAGKMYSTIAFTGNLVSASVPFAMATLLNEGVETGKNILLVGLGAGASGGAFVYKT